VIAASVAALRRRPTGEWDVALSLDASGCRTLALSKEGVPMVTATKTTTGKTAAKKAVARKAPAKKVAKKASRWSQHVTETSDAMDLKPDVFKGHDPKAIARSIKSSAEHSARRKSDPYRSAISMLTFYINRAGHNLAPDQKKTLEQAKDVLRDLFGKEPAAKKATANKLTAKKVTAESSGRAAAKKRTPREPA
jgi:hypothetical protein